MANLLHHIVLFFGLLALLAACGESPDSGVLREPNVVEDVPVADKVAYASHFPIFDMRSGRAALPRTPQGKTPFGVLLGFVNSHQLEMCTISHWRGGQLLTNAHCVATVSKADAYYVVYFDTQGKHRYQVLESFGYVGDQNADDVAVVNIDSSVAQDWDELDASLLNSNASIDAGLSHGNFPVTVWSFDPLTAHPELGPLYSGSQGAVFYPKNCTGFRTQPEITLYDLSGRSMPYPATTVDSHKHIFVDNCDGAPIQGNSGSWISAANDPSHGYGPFHWIITLRDQPIVRSLRLFEYTGSSGEKVSSPAAPNFSFYFVGTDLNYVLANHPQAFSTTPLIP